MARPASAPAPASANRPNSADVETPASAHRPPSAEAAARIGDSDDVFGVRLPSTPQDRRASSRLLRLSRASAPAGRTSSSPTWERRAPPRHLPARTRATATVTCVETLGFHPLGHAGPPHVCASTDRLQARLEKTTAGGRRSSRQGYSGNSDTAGRPLKPRAREPDRISSPTKEGCSRSVSTSADRPAPGSRDPTPKPYAGGCCRAPACDAAPPPPGTFILLLPRHQQAHPTASVSRRSRSMPPFTRQGWLLSDCSTMPTQHLGPSKHRFHHTRLHAARWRLAVIGSPNYATRSRRRPGTPSRDPPKAGEGGPRRRQAGTGGSSSPRHPMSTCSNVPSPPHHVSELYLLAHDQRALQCHRRHGGLLSITRPHHKQP